MCEYCKDYHKKTLHYFFSCSKLLSFVIAVSSAPSARSPFEKHVVLPPISAKKPGSDVAQETFMTIPTVKPESLADQTQTGEQTYLIIIIS